MPAREVSPGRRRTLGMLWWGGLGFALPRPVRSAQPQRLDGTFIQLLAHHGKWRDEEWTRLFTALNELGLRELLVQWTVYDQTALFGSPGASPLEPLLGHAQQTGISVLLGLVYDPAYWNEAARSPERLPALFGTLFDRSLSTARALLPLVARHPTVSGWYLCEEVDDWSWDAPRRALLLRHLERMADALQDLTPGCRIALSGFTDGRSRPEAVEHFWRELLVAAPSIDRVLFQDGVGAGKLKLNELDAYFAAVARAAGTAGRDLSIVVETFRQTAGAPIDGTPFAAAPASIARLAAQIDTASAHTSSLIAFSVPEYLSPLGGPAAQALYRDYRDYIAGRHAR